MSLSGGALIGALTGTFATFVVPLFIFKGRSVSLVFENTVKRVMFMTIPYYTLVGGFVAYSRQTKVEEEKNEKSIIAK
jgi:hypothetical protein